MTLKLTEAGLTADILTDVLGFAAAEQEGRLRRYRIDGGGLGGIVDLEVAEGFIKGRPGGGSVHHIAFRARDEAAQAAMVGKLAEDHGIRTTELKDRKYFRSVYFREPGHVLFEIATDAPGFAVDEPAERLGEALQLPEFLAARRAEIKSRLPPL